MLCVQNLVEYQACTPVSSEVRGTEFNRVKHKIVKGVIVPSCLPPPLPQLQKQSFSFFCFKSRGFLNLYMLHESIVLCFYLNQVHHPLT